MNGRPLAEIILNLEQTHSDWGNKMDALERAQKAEGDDSPHALELDRETDDLDNKLDNLREEFRSRFKELTGVAWSNVEHATMSGAL